MTIAGMAVRSGACLLYAALLAACGQGGQDAADQVLLGGRVYTVDPALPWASAVAVAGDRLVYVGDDDGARAFVGDETVVTDLGGRFVMPGLIDGHTHPGYIDLEQYGEPLPESGHDDLIAAVAARAAEPADGGWLRLCCWPVGQYAGDGQGPHKRDLDAVAPDRPVWITSSAWHSAWLNSKALEALGVDATTPDPRTGVAEYVRDGAGELTGWLKEGAGWQHFATVFDVDEATQTRSIEAFLKRLAERGVTTVYDAGNFGYEDHVYGFLAGLEAQGRLPIRYEGTYQVYVPERRQHAVAEMKRLRAAYGGERLRFRTIKLFMDGIFANRSGAVIEAYSDVPGHYGETMLTAEELRDFLVELHEEKFDLHIHAIGDRAVRTALDGVEAAQREVGDTFYPRVSLAHLHLVDDADMPRFAKLGVTANFTAWWHGYRGPAASNRALGPERGGRIFLAKSIVDAGGNVTFSSDDWFLHILSPFLGMQVAHNRQYPPEWLAEDDDPAAVRPPASARLDLESLVRGYTINGAYPFRLEDQVGSLETGKLADLVVLEDNLFDVDRQAIHRIEPVAVMLEGQWTHGQSTASDWRRSATAD